MTTSLNLREVLIHRLGRIAGVSSLSRPYFNNAFEGSVNQTAGHRCLLESELRDIDECGFDPMRKYLWASYLTAALRVLDVRHSPTTQAYSEVVRTACMDNCVHESLIKALDVALSAHGTMPKKVYSAYHFSEDSEVYATVAVRTPKDVITYKYIREGSEVYIATGPTGEDLFRASTDMRNTEEPPYLEVDPARDFAEQLRNQLWILGL